MSYIAFSTKPKPLMILILLMIPIYSTSIVTAEDGTIESSSSQSNLQLSQVEIIQTNLSITSVIINDGKLPEEGELIEVIIDISNDDDSAYLGLELILVIEESVLVQHGPKPEPDVYNESLSIIPASAKISQQMSFLGNFGQYTLTASLFSNGTPLPNSVHTMTFQVISQPIGSVPTLVFTTFIIVVFLLVLIPIPLVFEKIKSK